jgi:hypothetical protein
VVYWRRSWVVVRKCGSLELRGWLRDGGGLGIAAAGKSGFARGEVPACGGGEGNTDECRKKKGTERHGGIEVVGAVEENAAGCLWKRGIELWELYPAVICTGYHSMVVSRTGIYRWHGFERFIPMKLYIYRTN